MMLDTTLKPLAWTLDGAPIWPLLGAEDPENPQGGGGDNENPDPDDDPHDGLTDAGRQAIERERQAAERAKNAYKPYRQLMREFGIANVDQLRERLTTQQQAPAKEGEGTQSTVDVEAARREARAEAEAAANQRILKSEIRRLASESFIDASDALPHLDLSTYEVDDDGNVDEAAITKDLKAVLKVKPHLGKRSKPASYDGGSRRTADEPQKMSDLIRSSVAARRGGSTR